MIGLARSGVPSAFGQKNVTLIVSASQASVVGGLLLTFETVIVYVSVDPFTTKPVGLWTTMSLRAVSLQPPGDWELGILERTFTTRCETSCWPADATARNEPLWARAGFDRSMTMSRTPRPITARPADLRTDDGRGFATFEGFLIRFSSTRLPRQPDAPRDQPGRVLGIYTTFASETNPGAFGRSYRQRAAGLSFVQRSPHSSISAIVWRTLSRAR